MPGNKSQTLPKDADTNTEDSIREYLQDHPDFLQRNLDLLDNLNITHASGSAISLVEKQVSVLRDRNVEMRHKLNALTGNAKDNDRLYDQTRKLVLSLLEADDLSQLFTAFISAMKQDFDVEYSSVILFKEADVQNNDAANTEGVRIEPTESAKGEIGALIKSRKAVCGVLRKEELSYLFPNADGIGSAAVMPLIEDTVQGVIAVGSSDATRYSNSMGTLFLAHIAEVMVRLITRLD